MRLAVAAIACIAVSAPAFAITGNAPPASGWAARPIVMVGSTLGDQCTGTALAPDLVLTAAHCVMRKARYAVKAYQTGDVIRQMGQLTSGDPYDFDPPESMFNYQHDPHWLDTGNLLVSTHDASGTSGKQIAAEYTVDDKTKTLTRVWSYVSTDIWAEQMGEATRLPNGNTMQGYGQNGAAREVTSDGEEAWYVSWVDPPAQRSVGHLTLIEDLYALNVGGTTKK